MRVHASIAMGSLSRGLAATDRIHQRAFAQDAEAHRREMIKLLNEDYMYNADGAGAAYTANEELWSQFEDFDGQRRVRRRRLLLGLDARIPREELRAHALHLVPRPLLRKRGEPK